jgi:hypothetical protein
MAGTRILRLFALTAITCLAIAGCGSSSAPSAVHLALIAPTDGATVNVDRLLVTGSVEPANSKVKVGGRIVKSSHGRFGVWISLRRGLNRLHIDASARGLQPDRLNLAVRSTNTPSHSRHAHAAPQALPDVSSLHGGTWTESIKVGWVNACVVGGGWQSYCECTLRYAMQVGTPDGMVESILNAEAERRRPTWLVHAVARCI